MTPRAAILVAVAGALWLAPGALASGWCGSGETAADRPAAVTGPQVHAVVALPTGAPDTFADDANALADTEASILTWWQGQDPTRVPRFDLASFGASTCLDISFVRLPDANATYAGVGVSTAYTVMSSELAAAGLDDPFEKYLVFYDGGEVEAGVCGVGSGDFSSGPSYAIVYLDDCGDTPLDSVAAHELLHAFGALPAGAPNFCAVSPIDGQPDHGHPCDSTTDVLYPLASDAPLSQLVLDFNHDDYYAHSGSWIDIQDSIWLHLLAAPQVRLQLEISGGGAVASDVPGVLCASSCTTQWDRGSPVTLRARPSSTTRLVRWSGGCSGSDDCVLTLAAATTVSAVFGPTHVAVRASTSRGGTVRCTPRCSTRFAAGTSLVLRAMPARGWRFSGWTGACAGRGAVCRPSTDAAVSTRASFRKR